jgi:anti-sigma regulatory factor (Ser/Thr protein kinase)
MGQMRASLRAYAIEGHPPAVALTLLDRLLRMTRDDAMATAIYAVVDTDTGTVTYASAGHLPPLIIGPDGSRFAAPATGPPVGVVADPDYGEAELSLAPGETMLFYTDGLVEVRGESLDVGLARLQAAAEVITDPEVLCDHVSGKLVPREGSEDDVALVAIQSRPIGTELDLSVKAAPGALAPMRRTLRRWLEMVGATAEETGAIVLACGEASANAVEHAYGPGAAYFRLNARCDANVVEVRVSDSGRWRDHRGENRGRGEYIMRATMDSVNFERSPQGTQVVMQKVIVGA